MVKKIFASFVLGVFLFSATPVAAGIYETSYAAVGGAKVSPKTSTKKPVKTAPKSNAKSNDKKDSKKTGPNQKEYAPSKSAKDLNKEPPKTNSAAPATNSANATNAANASTTGIGNTMRNVGLFAGGMLLGSLLGNSLGMGGMGEIFGIIANILMIALLFLVIRYLWRKFRGRNESNPYQNNYEKQNMNLPPINDAPPYEEGYNPKTTADRYRNR